MNMQHKGYGTWAVLALVWGLGIADRSHAIIGGTGAGAPIDLKKRAPAVRQVEEFLRNLAQGNEREAEVVSLTLDPQRALISGEVRIRSRQVSGKIFNPLTGKRQPVVAYDWTVTGKFWYNARTNEGDAVLDLGHGVKLDTRRIRRIMEGDVGEILRLIPNPGGIAQKKFRNEYDQIRASIEQQYGRGNVYFASKRFVDWAAPETAGNWVLKAVVAGPPAAVEQAMREASKKALEEAGDFGTWLQAKGAREAASTARAILSGQRVDWPYLAVKWQTVGYFSSNWLGGQQIGPEIRVTHAAFYVVWKANNGGGNGGGGGLTMQAVTAEMERILGRLDFEANQAFFGHWRNRYLEHAKNVSVEDLRTQILRDHREKAIPHIMRSILGNIDFEATVNGQPAYYGHWRNRYIEHARNVSYSMLVAQIRADHRR